MRKKITKKTILIYLGESIILSFALIVLIITSSIDYDLIQRNEYYSQNGKQEILISEGFNAKKIGNILDSIPNYYKDDIWMFSFKRNEFLEKVSDYPAGQYVYGKVYVYYDYRLEEVIWHETGHSIWHKLNETQKSRWNEIRLKNSYKFPLYFNKSADEFFAENFAWYNILINRDIFDNIDWREYDYYTDYTEEKIKSLIDQETRTELRKLRDEIAENYYD